MKSRYSRIHKVGQRKFRYNYDHNVIEWIDEMTEEMIADNDLWGKEHPHDGTPLWDETEDGHWLVDMIGCFLEDWEDDPQGMCEIWSNDIDSEVEMMLAYI